MTKLCSHFSDMQAKKKEREVTNLHYQFTLKEKVAHKFKESKLNQMTIFKDKK